MEETSLENAFLKIHEGNKKEAHALFEKLLSKNKKNFQALHQLGLLYFENNNNDVAKELIEQSLYYYPFDPLYWSNYAIILLKENNYEKAIQAQKKSLDLNPDNPLTHLQLIESYKLKGDLERALSHSNQLISSYKKYIKGWQIKGEILLKMKQPSEAKEVLSNSLKIEEHSKTYFLIARCLEEEETFTESWSTVEKANNILAVNSSTPNSYWQEIRSYHSLLPSITRVLNSLPHPPLKFIYHFPTSQDLQLNKTVIPIDQSLNYLISKLIKSPISPQNIKEILHYREIMLPNTPFSEKHPLTYIASTHLFSIGLIHTLFPHATHHLLHENPIDICIDNYVQKNSSHSFVDNCVSIEGAIKLYHKVMHSFLNQVQTLQIPLTMTTLAPQWQNYLPFVSTDTNLLLEISNRLKDLKHD
jgi:tetratricopeptide (TPR) repeat protein